MNIAHVWIDWKINNMYRYDLDIELFNPTPESLEKGLIYWQWHFDFSPPPPQMEGGYIGLQLVRDQKIAIFSIWNALDGKSCQRFGHEGKGWQCLIPYPWELENKYRLSVIEGIKSNDGKWWSGEIYNYDNEETTIIGEILVPSDFGRLSPNNYYTCLEYGYFNSDCEDLPHTRVRFSDHYAYNGTNDGQANERAHKPKIEYPSDCFNSKITLFNDFSYIIEAGNNVIR